MNLAPIVLFTYNRPEHTRMTIEALKKNELASASDLIVFSDGPKTDADSKIVKSLRNYLQEIDGFKSVQVIARSVNFGLAESIIKGVTEIVKQFGKIIVLEDDLVTAPFFLRYMNEGLNLYEHHQEVASIHGYVYPVKDKIPEIFFLRGADCFGWATWKRAWDIFEENGQLLLEKIMVQNSSFQFDFDGSYPYTKMLIDQTEGKNDSWAVRWYASAFVRNYFTLYPGRSLVHHTGSDGSGTHSGFGDILDVVLAETPIVFSDIPVEQNQQAYEAFVHFLPKVSRPNIIYRIKRKISKFLTLII